MFGYVRPMRGELKVRQDEQFRAAYCGLCHAMRKGYGPLSRFLLNYDFTFLAILLSVGEEAKPARCLRCPASPIRGRQACPVSPAFEAAADESVILAWWKWRDTVADEGFFRSLSARLLSLVFLPAYRRAAARCPGFARTAQENLRALRAMEEEKIPSLDRPADAFARILQGGAPACGDEERSRTIGHILYHVGRFIYLADAVWDRQQDDRENRYNPVSARYGRFDGPLPDEVREELHTTMLHSIRSASSAFQLMPEDHWSDILGNIFYLGLPAVCTQVLDGTFSGPSDWRKERRKP